MLTLPYLLTESPKSFVFVSALSEVCDYTNSEWSSARRTLIEGIDALGSEDAILF